MGFLKKIDITWIETLIFILFFFFSLALMWKTFRISPEGDLEIATKAWSDFSATIPLIRSFSLGNNFPPQYPIFAGPPIRYHFIFFLIVGLLEKIGIRLDFALNTLSSLAFFSLLNLIYITGKRVFKNRAVGLISVLLFLFNGSFGFLEFFKKYPLSSKTMIDILQNTQFSTFGPYDGKVVSAFWSLNIFTNQRHLAFAYASFLLLAYLIFHYSNKPKELNYKKILLIAIFIGTFPFIHLAVFGMMGLSLIVSLFIYPKIGKKIIIIGFIAICLATPQLLYMGSSQNESHFFVPGYLVENLTLTNFIIYWLYNFGLGTIFIPIGYFLANKNQRKFFLIFLILFIFGNLFRVSSEMSANHKFFNLFIIGANFFIANAIVKFWKYHSGKVVSVFSIIFLTFTGVIDFFPIVNDTVITIKDYPNNLTVNYIVSNTPKNSVFLNSSYIFNPASLAGRKIFLGWPYFSWSAGYDTTSRDTELRSMLTPKSFSYLCTKLVNYKIDYIILDDPLANNDFQIDSRFFDTNFKTVFTDRSSMIKIYKVLPTCNLPLL